MRFVAGLAMVLTLAAGRPNETVTVSIDVHDAALVDVLTLLGAETGRNIVADSSVKDQRVTIRLQRVTLSQALSVLSASQGLAIRHVGDVIMLGTAESITRHYPDALKRSKDAGSFETYRLRYSRASEIAGALKTAFTNAVVVADDAQNLIVARGDDELHADIARFILQLDAPSAQVLFEVRVADVRPVNEQSDVGILLGGYDLSGQAVAGAATYAFTRNSLSINARLNALITSGHAQILATPRLLTLNNHEADLLIGETYPVTYFDTRAGGQQVQFVDIGVKLRLTPTIGSDGSVTAEMHPEYSAIEGFVGGYPVLTSRKVDSKLRVNDGETIVLGGLIRDIDSESWSRVPGLSSIPILGKVFQDRQRTHQRDEVVFLITPHVVTPYGRR
jgi:type II secretory pathway component GspD/PulD (secretin)